MISESSLEIAQGADEPDDCGEGGKGGGGETGKCILGFELVWKDQVRVMEKVSVDGHDGLADIETTLIAHYGVQYCVSPSFSL